MKSDLEVAFSYAAGEGLWIEQGGSVDEPSGYVAWFDLREMPAIVEFRNMLAENGMEQVKENLEGVWTLMEDDPGFTYVRKVNTEEEAVYWFNGRLALNAREALGL